ncbi:hypothetical protein CONPUDRAFT_164494 [Coniophora puteana RWD-64-598 SS2]|uniref:Uncharacterized protein n=1 Tax=Coniophora puteana (strain RWD-64-598) TaxID=741705 RepID=A0A5M3MR98_CONPW|nr:uncharacterized protein CONPUDRAFT_164494 [Coniophora puteana RWD-64-598 SS2]EIW81689.1 hypothetical protein CONPUDRAFT_164494 [Coniophora puteana RWD-64-598 SS2]
MPRRTFSLSHDYADSLSEHEFLIETAHKIPSHPLSRSDILSRRISIIGLVFTLVVGMACIITGAALNAASKGNPQTYFDDVLYVYSQTTPFNPTLLEIPILLLSALVTVCTEAIGYVHSTALRSELMQERRLVFNTNARLFTATRRRRWTGPNGVLCNVFMAVLLIMSFVSATLTFTTQLHIFVVSFVPMVSLGVFLILQVLVATYALSATHILTWDNNALETLTVLSRQRLVKRFPGRGMCSVSDPGTDPHPQIPSARQPSTWQARRDIRVVIVLMWAFTALCTVWGGVTYLARFKPPPEDNVETSFQWTLEPSYNFSPYLQWIVPWGSGGLLWTQIFGVMFIVQGTLATTLHLAGLAANTLRDEQMWRSASSPKGAAVQVNVLWSIVTPPNLLLLLAKPVLHWMMSLANTAEIDADEASDGGSIVAFAFWSVQYWNLSIGLVILTAIFTFLVMRRPRGPQPAAYGHFQTLANLIDDWPEEEDGKERLYWGDKGLYLDAGNESESEWDIGEKRCHAGTSGSLLAPVNMNALYA